VVGGFRWHHAEPVVGSLLLGLYDQDAILRHVGLTATFSAAKRRSLLDDVKAFVTNIAYHPWGEGFPHSEGPVGRLPGAASRWGYDGQPTWVPLRPELVCEVSYDHLHGDRFRHPPHFKSWRPDRNARSCKFDQFESPTFDLANFVRWSRPVGD
jgi:ATP-dependent DNA ligase